MNKKLYGTILADPPWMERGGGKIVRGANKHYSLMKTDEICALDVQSLVEPSSHLYLWVTNGFLPDGLRVMDAWGFRYVTCLTWAKDRIGLGQYFRGQTEQLLFGVNKGNPPPPFKTDSNGKRCQGSTLIVSPRRKHSEKPPEARAVIEKVSYGPFLELFAREKTTNWDVWGNEIKSDVELKQRDKT